MGICGRVIVGHVITDRWITAHCPSPSSLTGFDHFFRRPKKPNFFFFFSSGIVGVMGSIAAAAATTGATGSGVRARSVWGAWGPPTTPACISPLPPARLPPTRGSEIFDTSDSSTSIILLNRRRPSSRCDESRTAGVFTS